MQVSNLNTRFLATLFWMILIFGFTNSVAQNCPDKFYISEITFSGNKTTKPQVIERELSFERGDSVCSNNLSSVLTESKHNLEKLPLFNFVTITPDTLDLQNIAIHIHVVERWYLMPIFTATYADRNLNVWLKEKDWTRIRVGVGLEKYNFRGQNENISGMFVYGYDKQVSFAYRNIYFDKKRKNGASIFFKYYKRNETPYIVENDKFKQLKLQGEFITDVMQISGEYYHRIKPGEQHIAGTAFELRHAADTLFDVNKKYFSGVNDLSRYVYLRYIYDKDTRNSRIFPVSGYKIRFFLQGTGLGLFSESNINFIHIRPQVSFFTGIGKRFVLGNHLAAKKTYGSTLPFYLQDALGTDFNIRGYEYYVIHGTDFILNNNSFNFELLPKTVFSIPYIPFEKFSKVHITIYIGAFADVAYVKNTDPDYMKHNKLANEFLYSSGLSLNILTYYDKLLRFDYSWNHLGERHFFFHINAPF